MPVSFGCSHVASVVCMSKSARYCVTCGKKFYPKSYSAYPQDDYQYNEGVVERYEVSPSHKHFHSQSCMKEWIARHSREFSNLIDNLSHNVIQEDSNQQKG